MRRTIVLLAWLLLSAAPASAQVFGWPMGVAPPVFVVSSGFAGGTVPLATTFAGAVKINNIVTLNGPVTADVGPILFSTGLQFFDGSTGTTLSSATENLLSVTRGNSTSGLEFNASPATLGACTGGTITTGSHSQAGGYTGNTSSSCVINFGTSWTNAPFCVAMSIASTTHPRVSATGVASITVTGGVSGEAITYTCMGRIGT